MQKRDHVSEMEDCMFLATPLDSHHKSQFFLEVVNLATSFSEREIVLTVVKHPLLLM
jgi:hypothetical protein